MSRLVLTRSRAAVLLTVGAVGGIVMRADSLFLAAYGKADVESDVPRRTDAVDIA